MNLDELYDLLNALENFRDYEDIICENPYYLVIEDVIDMVCSEIDRREEYNE